MKNIFDLIPRQKKGQTAMEYLMTYGWAIVIAVIVGIALWRLGVFNPGAGTVASGFSEFQVIDHKITSEGIATIIIENADKQSRSITLNSATIDSVSCTGDTGSLGVGSNQTITCTGLAGGSSGSPYTGIEVQINYTINGLDHLETGLISGDLE